MKTLELFCGTKSFSNVAQNLGHSIYTVDKDGSFEPTEVCDILNWKPSKNLLNVDILWASPPCTCFSVASIGTHWGGGYRAYKPKTNNAKIALNIVKKTIEIIKIIKPKYWFIENPRGVLRKLNIMNELPRKTITYCQYGDTRMKPTDIWTNCDIWIPRPMCKNGDPCHEAAPRGSTTGTQGIKLVKNRSKIPDELFKDIFKHIST